MQALWDEIKSKREQEDRGNEQDKMTPRMSLVHTHVPFTKADRSSHCGTTGSAAAWEPWDMGLIPGPAQCCCGSVCSCGLDLPGPGAPCATGRSKKRKKKKEKRKLPAEDSRQLFLGPEFCLWRIKGQSDPPKLSNWPLGQLTRL